MNSTWKKYNVEKKVYFISITAIAIIVITFIFLSLYSNPYFVELYINTLTVVAIGFAFWASLRVLNRQKWILYKLLKAPWLYISTGLGLWLTAETIWLAYIVILGKPLELSIADLAWILGYVFIFTGLYKSVKPLSSIVKSANLSYKTIKIVYVVPLAIGVILIGATLAAIPSAIGGYYPGNILDLLYLISYIVIATGIYVYSRQSLII